MSSPQFDTDLTALDSLPLKDLFPPFILPSPPPPTFLPLTTFPPPPTFPTPPTFPPISTQPADEAQYWSIAGAADHPPLLLYFSTNPTAQSPAIQAPPTLPPPPLTQYHLPTTPRRESVIQLLRKAPPPYTPSSASGSNSCSSLPFTPDNPTTPSLSSHPPSFQAHEDHGEEEEGLNEQAGEKGEEVKKGKKGKGKVKGVRKLTSPYPLLCKMTSTSKPTASLPSSTSSPSPYLTSPSPTPPPKKGRPRKTNQQRRKEEKVEAGSQDLVGLALGHWQQFVHGEIEDWEFCHSVMGACEALTEIIDKPEDTF